LLREAGLHAESGNPAQQQQRYSELGFSIKAAHQCLSLHSVPNIIRCAVAFVLIELYIIAR
jgi:hypothetical protein